MIPSTTYISNLLSDVDTRFRKASSVGASNDLLTILSKFAVMELSGWCEESLDEVYNDVKIKIIDKDSIDIIDEKIKFVSSFDRKTFESMIGLFGVLKFERELSTTEKADYDKFLTTISKLYKLRCKNAHAHIKKILVITKPSDLQIYLNDINKGFILIDRVISTI